MELIKDLGTRLINGTWIRYAIFKCSDCLQEVEKPFSNGLKYKSCGCTKSKGKNNPNYKHDGKGTKIYNVWIDMKQRILNSKNKDYPDYGGRGITICPEWINDYTKFRDWALNNGYIENLQINRVWNDGNYEPSNCNFIPSKENSRNRRGQKIKNIEMANEIRVLYATGNYTQKEIAIKYNVSQVNISRIINNKGWV